MNKKNTRQKTMKSKLIAAVAMLLVSCIMMVSSTYAWFTLSTAPEVQGITTTVGANGNLEIALSPTSGDPDDIGFGTSDSTLEWVYKNLTWGNLLDLSDESYGLGEITLMPSQLNISAGADATQLPTLGVNPLKVAVYGADGRIERLSAEGVTYGAKRENANVDGFIVNDGSDDYYGIRAIGTSSTASETALNFQNALSAINNNRGAANGQISTALATYGDTLAAIALKYAAGDTTGYESYVTDVRAMLDELQGASDKIETALYNALLAISISKIPVDISDPNNIVYIADMKVDMDGAQVSVYDLIKNAMTNKIPLETTWTELNSKAPVALSYFTLLNDAYDSWRNIDAKVTAAKTAAASLSTDACSDTEIKSVVGYLMDTTNDQSVTINGLPLTEVQAAPGKVFGGGASGINLQLNAGSGIFADYGKLTGDVSGSVVLPDNTSVNGMPVGGATVTLMTTTEPDEGPVLTQLRSAIAYLGVAEGDNSSASVVDVTYGYALDFIFRTNAANSNLLLQSDAAQRIYGDSQNGATMGAGSTLTFDGTTNGLQTLVDMMSGIRVVFTETASDGGDIYGIAKVAINQLPMNFAAKTVTVGVDADNNPTYTDDADVDGGLDLALTVTSTGAVNTMTWSYGTDAIANNVANATVETVVDTARSLTYLRVAVYALSGNATDGYTVDFTADPTDYFHIYDQDVEIAGELCLYNYTVNDTTGALQFTTPMEVQRLCTLGQNVATKITALVYLDGDYVDNSDVGNSENGIYKTGKLNLQFASSANLVPMDNSTLHNGHGVTLPEAEGLTITGNKMVAANTDYTFAIAAETGYTYTVTYAIDGVNKGAPTEEGTGNFKIEAANITGDIEIFVEVTPPAATP